MNRIKYEFFPLGLRGAFNMLKCSKRPLGENTSLFPKLGWPKVPFYLKAILLFLIMKSPFNFWIFQGLSHTQHLISFSWHPTEWAQWEFLLPCNGEEARAGPGPESCPRCPFLQAPVSALEPVHWLDHTSFSELETSLRNIQWRTQRRN